MQRLRLTFTRFLSVKTMIFLLFILTLFLVINACRKDEQRTTFDETQALLRFFSYPSTLDTNIKQIANDVERQNNQFHFLEYFIDNNGYPAWDKYQMVASGIGTVAIIPFSFDGQEETNGFVICRKSPDNDFSFELYKKSYLLDYGFIERDNDSLNAMEVQTVLNKFNYDNFDITTCHLADKRMLPDSILANHPDETDVTKLTGHIKTENRKKGGAVAQLAESCITYSYETDWWYNPNGDACNCDGDEYYSYTSYDLQTTCYYYGGNAGVTYNYGGGSDQQQWWTGGGSHGGGGSGSGGGGSPPPPPVRDSNYFKGLLNKEAVAISKMSDSAFKLAQNGKVEYSLIITQKDTNVYARNLKTDNDTNAVNMNYRTPTGEKLVGEDHTHQDDKPTSLLSNRSSLDIGDVYALWDIGNFSKQDFISFVEMGDERQAIVVEDPVKAANFVNALKRINYLDIWYAKATSLFTGNNWRQATLNATLYLLGNLSSSGIGIYRTIDAGKVLFTKLN